MSIALFIASSRLSLESNSFKSFLLEGIFPSDTLIIWFSFVPETLFPLGSAIKFLAYCILASCWASGDVCPQTFFCLFNSPK